MQLNKTYYAWYEKDTGTDHYFVPMSDPMEYEYPFDYVFYTIEDAHTMIKEVIEDAQEMDAGCSCHVDIENMKNWILCEVELKPVCDKNGKNLKPNV